MADVLRLFVAGVWLVHGVYNKLLGGSPRHLAIIQSVPGLAGADGSRRRRFRFDGTVIRRNTSRKNSPDTS